MNMSPDDSLDRTVHDYSSSSKPVYSPPVHGDVTMEIICDLLDQKLQIALSTALKEFHAAEKMSRSYNVELQGVPESKTVKSIWNPCKSMWYSEHA